MRTLLGLSALALVLAAAPAEAQNGRCSRDVFAIDGQSVTVSVCAGAAESGAVAVSETFKGAAASFSRTSSIPLLAGAVSRETEDVALQPLGIAKTLHLTLAYRDGAAWIESALLRPGAVPLK